APGTHRIGYQGLAGARLCPTSSDYARIEGGPKSSAEGWSARDQGKMLRSWSVAPDGPPHRLSERGDCRLRLAHQHLRLIAQLSTVLDEPPRSLARVLCSLPHLLRKHRAAVQVTPETLGQILAAARAQMCAVGKQIAAELMLPEARIAYE